nr:hypothetical protein [Mycoplasmopsis bovis]
MEKGLIAIGIGISMISGLGVGLGQGLALLVRQLKQLEEILKQQARLEQWCLLVKQFLNLLAIYALVISILLMFAFN